MKSKMKYKNIFPLRMSVTLLLLLSILFLPWWITASLSFLAMLYFDAYFEMLIVALIFDSLYSADVQKFAGYQFVSVTITLVLLILLMYIKKRFSFYSR